MMGDHHQGTSSHEATPPHAPTHMHRRTFLKASTALVVSGLVGPTPGGGARWAMAHEKHQGAHIPGTRAAAREGAILYALSFHNRTTFIHTFRVGGNGNLALDSSLEVPLPEMFVPRAIHKLGDHLLIGGGHRKTIATVTIDNRPETVLPTDRDAMPAGEGVLLGLHVIPVYTTLPAIYRLQSGELQELPSIADVPWGTVSALSGSGASTVMALIEGSESEEEAYNNITYVAESFDGGKTWASTVLASRLGEGHGSQLVVAESTVAVTVDQAGRRIIHERQKGSDSSWQPVTVANTSGGPILAVREGADRALVEFVDQSARSHLRRQYVNRLTGRVHVEERIDTIGEAVSVIPVSGTARELLVVSSSHIQLIS